MLPPTTPTQHTTRFVWVSVGDGRGQSGRGKAGMCVGKVLVWEAGLEGCGREGQEGAAEDKTWFIGSSCHGFVCNWVPLQKDNAVIMN